MAKQRANKSAPLAPINDWVRRACESAGMSYQAVADELTRRGVGNYERSKVQKMTVSRGVSAEEAAAISKITGYPLAAAGFDPAFADAYPRLHPDNQRLVDEMIRQLLLAQDRT